MQTYIRFEHKIDEQEWTQEIHIKGQGQLREEARKQNEW